MDGILENAESHLRKCGTVSLKIGNGIFEKVELEEKVDLSISKLIRKRRIK